ncbi:MAG: glycosyltransferase family 2 protein [Opitutales bacterium]
MNRPVLLVHYNRPFTTRRQLEALIPVAPRRIWILCDGPRAQVPGDAERVSQVRALLDTIPWDCEVKRLYRRTNLGCCRNMAEGITWFLNDCGAGIILEDDIQPHPSFFSFCDELLDRYADNSEVHAISGQQGSPHPLRIQADYGFTDYFDCWGWATWRRAWSNYDPLMGAWRDRTQWHSICKRVLRIRRACLYWWVMFCLVDRGKRDSWAYRYLLSIWKVGGCTIVPRQNLTKNIGFCDNATQTAHLREREMQLAEQDFPLRHPHHLRIDPTINQWYEDQLCSKSFSVRVRWLLAKLMRPLATGK